MKSLWSHQRKAVDELKNGSVLVGDIGSGKTLTALAYFYEKVLGGSMDPPITPKQEVELFVITTAMKRDRGDWQSEIDALGLVGVVDSWNKNRRLR